MSISDPFQDMKPCTVGSPMPKGVADGLYVIADGNLAFTTMGGTVIGAFAVVAGQLIPCRVRTVDAGTTATVLAGYH